MEPVYTLPPRARLWRRALQWIAILVALVLVGVVVWYDIPSKIIDGQLAALSEPARAAVTFSPAKHVLVTGLAWAIALAAALIPLGASVVFGAFATGRVFEAPAVRAVAFFGWMVVAFALIQILTPSMMQLALTADSPRGQRVLTLSIGTAHVTTLLVGLVVLAIAQVHARAVAIADDHRQIV